MFIYEFVSIKLNAKEYLLLICICVHDIGHHLLIIIKFKA